MAISSTAILVELTQLSAPMQIGEEQANSTQKGLGLDSDPGPSCDAAVVLTTLPPGHPCVKQSWEIIEMF